MSLKRKLAAIGISATVLIGGSVALAPSASAVGGHFKCTTDANWNYKLGKNNVNLRSNPGTSYSSYGLMTKGTSVYLDCAVVKGDGAWYYIKVNNRAHSGKRGWIRTDMIAW